MSPKGPIVSPKLADHLVGHGFYPQHALVERNTPTRSSTGAEVDVWSTLLVDHPCRLAAAGGEEQRRPDGTIVPATHEIAFPDPLATFTERDRVTIDGTVFDVLLVRASSTDGHTTCLVERIE